MEEIEHPMYKKCSLDQADGAAWVFSGPQAEPVLYPFKFPELGEEEIRVEQDFTGICYTDVHLIQQNWFPTPMPCCPGHEIYGKVIAKGPKVQGINIGDSVGVGYLASTCFQCEWCKKGKENLCDIGVSITFPNFGGFATHIQAHYKWAFQFPKSIPQEKGAPLMCAGVTVYSGIKQNCKPGQKVAVIGIGGLGHLAIQIAHKWGCQVYAVSRSNEKRQQVKDFGATDLILSTDPEQMKQYAEKFDVLLFCASNSSNKDFQQYVSLVSKNGKFVIMGSPESTANLQAPFFALVVNQLHFVGSLVGSRDDNIKCLEFCAKHQIYPKVEVFDFSDFKKAYQHIQTGKPNYRCVLNVKDFIAKNLKKK